MPHGVQNFKEIALRIASHPTGLRLVCGTTENVAKPFVRPYLGVVLLSTLSPSGWSGLDTS